MPETTLLVNAIEHFNKSTDKSSLTADRKKFLSDIQCITDEDGIRLINKIGGEQNNLIIVSGRLDDGSLGVISFSIVRKGAHFALQVISTLGSFIPTEDTVLGCRFSNGKEVLSGFSFPPINVEGTSYWANFAQISEEDLIIFIEADILSWQLKNKLSGASLKSDFQVLGADMLPYDELKFLFHTMAVAIAEDYLKLG